MSNCRKHVIEFWYHEEGIDFLRCLNCNRIEMASTPAIRMQ